MFENGSMSPADLNAVMGNNCMGGGSWSWLIIILFLFLFGTGGFGGLGNAAFTNADLQRGFDTQSIISKLNGLENGLCSLGYDQQAIMNGINQNVSTQGYNVSGTVATVGAELNQNLANVKYDAALNTQKIIENDTANTQKILDSIAQSKIDTLQSRINQLELQNAVCGVVRYPMASTYTSGANPFCGCGYNNAI